MGVGFGLGLLRGNGEAQLVRGKRNKQDFTDGRAAYPEPTKQASDQPGASWPYRFQRPSDTQNHFFSRGEKAEHTQEDDCSSKLVTQKTLKQKLKCAPKCRLQGLPLQSQSSRARGERSGRTQRGPSLSRERDLAGTQRGPSLSQSKAVPSARAASENRICF